MLKRATRTFLGSLLLMGLVLPSALAAESSSQAPGPKPVLAPVTNTPFQDLPPTHWAFGAVTKLLEAGVVSADPGARFRPEEPVSRAELVKMIVVARRKDTKQECQAMFRDVPCSSWFASAAEHAYRMGIVDGVGVDLFGPDLYVTRQQLFTIMVRALGRRWEAATQEWSVINTGLKKFTDFDKFAEWAKPAVAVAVRDGLASGYQDGTFRPEALASRAEAAALVSRVVLDTAGLTTVQVDGRTVVVQEAYNMVATAYAIGEPGVGQTTYTGLKVRVGAVAVDPNVIPLGKLLYIEGYGYAIAADIGGAIKGNRVDLFTFDHHDAAMKFGMQPRRVWVLP